MIKLNDVLNLKDLDNVKIRFNLMFGGNWEPTQLYKRGQFDDLMHGHYYNRKGHKSYQEGQITVGFMRIEADKWLLFHVGRVTKDLNILGGMGYEYEPLPEYEKYLGRLVIRFKNKVQQTVRKATSVIDECEVLEILPDKFDNDIFPGYENVRLKWDELSAVIDKSNWVTALRNQKGVYLITDRTNGKGYVGSASGENMLLGRWQSYVKNGHGGNKGLKVLPFEHIKENFEYSILEIFKSTTDDKLILSRESWWKKTLHSKTFGYNEN
ncbi:hypothetical protein BCU68_12420 [Vibrio sp. 10N.286.49.B3]|uniref:GIY-YIG nuclease family protein n=1 Tax=Vibrio sp. 10N.286.49.B3 TaxID=1880855 RepID=UPI000C860737|nr:GIY-YIG nuclease family protein [Vibrio sp. 10N.286.49.B3]PMH44646.1 hypothetical protein BCU68_12420 [Vibrio sp. 10N.286.49.B3]